MAYSPGHYTDGRLLKQAFHVEPVVVQVDGKKGESATRVSNSKSTTTAPQRLSVEFSLHHHAAHATASVDGTALWIDLTATQKRSSANDSGSIRLPWTSVLWMRNQGPDNSVLASGVLTQRLEVATIAKDAQNNAIVKTSVLWTYQHGSKLLEMAVCARQTHSIKRLLALENSSSGARGASLAGHREIATTSTGTRPRPPSPAPADSIQVDRHVSEVASQLQGVQPHLWLQGVSTSSAVNVIPRHIGHGGNHSASAHVESAYTLNGLICDSRKLSPAAVADIVAMLEECTDAMDELAVSMLHHQQYKQRLCGSPLLLTLIDCASHAASSITNLGHLIRRRQVRANRQHSFDPEHALALQCARVSFLRAAVSVLQCACFDSDGLPDRRAFCNPQPVGLARLLHLLLFDPTPHLNPRLFIRSKDIRAATAAALSASTRKSSIRGLTAAASDAPGAAAAVISSPSAAHGRASERIAAASVATRWVVRSAAHSARDRDRRSPVDEGQQSPQNQQPALLYDSEIHFKGGLVPRSSNSTTGFNHTSSLSAVGGTAASFLASSSSPSKLRERDRLHPITASSPPFNYTVFDDGRVDVRSSIAAVSDSIARSSLSNAKSTAISTLEGGHIGKDLLRRLRYERPMTPDLLGLASDPADPRHSPPPPVPIASFGREIADDRRSPLMLAPATSSPSAAAAGQRGLPFPKSKAKQGFFSAATHDVVVVLKPNARHIGPSVAAPSTAAVAAGATLSVHRYPSTSPLPVSPLGSPTGAGGSNVNGIASPYARMDSTRAFASERDSTARWAGRYNSDRLDDGAETVFSHLDHEGGDGTGSGSASCSSSVAFSPGFALHHDGFGRSGSIVNGAIQVFGAAVRPEEGAAGTIGGYSELRLQRMGMPQGSIDRLADAHADSRDLRDACVAMVADLLHMTSHHTSSQSAHDAFLRKARLNDTVTSSSSSSSKFVRHRQGHPAAQYTQFSSTRLSGEAMSLMGTALHFGPPSRDILSRRGGVYAADALVPVKDRPIGNPNQRSHASDGRNQRNHNGASGEGDAAAAADDSDDQSEGEDNSVMSGAEGDQGSGDDDDEYPEGQGQPGPLQDVNLSSAVPGMHRYQQSGVHAVPQQPHDQLRTPLQQSSHHRHVQGRASSKLKIEDVMVGSLFQSSSMIGGAHGHVSHLHDGANAMTVPDSLMELSLQRCVIPFVLHVATQVRLVLHVAITAKTEWVQHQHQHQQLTMQSAVPSTGQTHVAGVNSSATIYTFGSSTGIADRLPATLHFGSPLPTLASGSPVPVHQPTGAGLLPTFNTPSKLPVAASSPLPVAGAAAHVLQTPEPSMQRHDAATANGDAACITAGSPAIGHASPLSTMPSPPLSALKRAQMKLSSMLKFNGSGHAGDTSVSGSSPASIQYGSPTSPFLRWSSPTKQASPSPHRSMLLLAASSSQQHEQQPPALEVPYSDAYRSNAWRHADADHDAHGATMDTTTTTTASIHPPQAPSAATASSAQSSYRHPSFPIRLLTHVRMLHSLLTSAPWLRETCLSGLRVQLGHVLSLPYLHAVLHAQPHVSHRAKPRDHGGAAKPAQTAEVAVRSPAVLAMVAEAHTARSNTPAATAVTNTASDPGSIKRPHPMDSTVPLVVVTHEPAFEDALQLLMDLQALIA